MDLPASGSQVSGQVCGQDTVGHDGYLVVATGWPVEAVVDLVVACCWPVEAVVDLVGLGRLAAALADH